jgi:glycosyltransferase involved in cell wall biosynthesis
MRILEVSGSGTVGVPPMGPVTSVIFQLATEFRRLGHEATVADVGAPARALTVPCVEIDSPRCGGGESFEAESRFVEQLLRQDPRRFDIIHVHDWKIAHLLQRRGIGVIYTSHTPLWANLRGLARMRDAIRGLLGPHERSVIRRSRLTVALGDYLRVSGANITVIPSGIRADEWRPERIPHGEFTILCMARLSREKGVHIFVEALRDLEFPYQAFVIGSRVGRFEHEQGRSTPYADRVLAAAHDLPITFTGFIPNTSPEFRHYLARADLVVVPSLFEAQGTVVLEALAMGIPVVASEVGGIPMMVTNDVGLLVRAGDPQDLRRALGELYRSPERRASMAARARPHVLEHFSWERSARRHLESFARLSQRS